MPWSEIPVTATSIQEDPGRVGWKQKAEIPLPDRGGV